jgi:hypothetical protein
MSYFDERSSGYASRERIRNVETANSLCELDCERENNKKKKESCNTCVWFHEGIEVDHNHCDNPTSSHAMEMRANGRLLESCPYFMEKEAKP